MHNERLSEEMTEDYEETILSMRPRHIEKARVRNKPEAPHAVIGLFHQLPEELTDSLIVTGQRHANAT